MSERPAAWPPAGLPDNEPILSVSELTAAIRGVLQQTLPACWVEGEISNYACPAAGHAYFTLKDETAQIRCVIWRSSMERIPFDLHDGLSVLLRGRLDVYGARGQYQLVGQHLVPKGVGPLELAFRQLTERLAAEGLFDPTRKRAIPTFPDRIALITSPQGAAIRDFFEVARRRWPRLQVVVLPVSVQGDRAVPEILAALTAAQKLEVRLIALIRGGGSLEDLWAFNDERLARALAVCCHPVVTGIGHEVDVTIADLVADLRALTPSEAAERIFPDCQTLQVSVAQFQQRLLSALQHRLQRERLRLERLENQRPFRDPHTLVADSHRRLDELERTFSRASATSLQGKRQQYEQHLCSLEALNPLHVLRRGYCVVRRQRDGLPVQQVAQVAPTETIIVQFAQGSLTARVEEVQHD